MRGRSLRNLEQYTDASIRVPFAVLFFEIVGAAVGLGLLALYLAILGCGVITVVLAAAFVSVLLLIRSTSTARPAGS